MFVICCCFLLIGRKAGTVVGFDALMLVGSLWYKERCVWYAGAKEMNWISSDGLHLKKLSWLMHAVLVITFICFACFL